MSGDFPSLGQTHTPELLVRSPSGWIFSISSEVAGRMNGMKLLITTSHEWACRGSHNVSGSLGWSD